MKSISIAGLAACGAVWTSIADATPFLVEVSPSGPCTTVASAVERVREKRRNGSLERGASATIVVRPGRYVLDRTLRLGPDDSHLHFLGSGMGESVLTDLRPLPPFERMSDGCWSASLASASAVDHVFVNGRRANRAASPNRGYYYMRDAVGEFRAPETGRFEDGSRRAFYAYPADVADVAALSPTDRSNVVVRVYQSWSTLETRLTAVDVASGLVVNEPSGGWPYFFWGDYEPRYRLENFRTALDMPGEWFHDTNGQCLLYVPRGDERIETAQAEVPTLDCLIVLEGQPGHPVEDVTFSDLGFEGSARRQARSYYHGQGALMAGEAVRVSQARRIAFERICVRRTAGYAISFDQDVSDASVKASLLENLGAGGVRICGSATNPIARVTVSDTIMRSGGHVFPEGVGVLMQHARNCTIEHNDISDLHYTGISMGWTWGYAPTEVRNNRIAFNRIRQIGHRVLSDLGGIYTLGDCAGSEIVGNWISDVRGYNYTGWGAHGLYADEGSANMVFASNLIVRTDTPYVHQHYGRDNIFANNVFWGSSLGGVLRSRDEPHVAFRAERNIFCNWNADECAIGGARLQDCPVTNVVFRSNLWHPASALATNDFFGVSWEQWRSWGQDASSVVADPLFADPAHDDFRLMEGSPAHDVGFVPFDYRMAGVRGPDDWRRAAAMLSPACDVLPTEPRARRTRAISLDFECPDSFGGVLGIQFSRQCDIGRQKGNARSGDWALRLRHPPRPSSAWHPHFHFPVWTGPAGRHRLAFSFFLEDENTAFACEWRDWAPAGKAPGGRRHVVGPRLSVRGLVVDLGCAETIPVRVRKWYDCVMVLSYASGVSPTLDLSLVDEDGNASSLKTTIGDVRFGSVDWIGFLSLCDQEVDSSYLLDKLSFGADDL